MKNFQQSFFLVLVIFSASLMAEETVIGASTAKELIIKKSAKEDVKQAEDELLQLEATVGEHSEEQTVPTTAQQDKIEQVKGNVNTPLDEDASPSDIDEASSKPWLPAAKDFDWVQLTSGEWLKGEIKSMYSETLEFDSDKLDLLEIDWDDVKYLKSYRPSNINIEYHQPITGSLQISEDKVTISNDGDIQEFDRIELISLTPAGDNEKDLWSIKATLGLNVKGGNTEQVDYTAKFNAKRRTAKKRLLIDYIGNISKTNNDKDELIETINNHRLGVTYDVYVTRYFFYQPATGEYFRDPFQNINRRLTAGVGVGYTLLDSDKYKWDVTGGPAYVSTLYESVQLGEDDSVKSGAVAFGTHFDAELTETLDFILKYNILAARKSAGGYTHHLIATFESELTGHLDFDVSMVWDRISQPRIDSAGNTPKKDDVRLSIGVTYTY